jgi:hypothetical protein
MDCNTAELHTWDAADTVEEAHTCVRNEGEACKEKTDIHSHTAEEGRKVHRNFYHSCFHPRLVEEADRHTWSEDSIHHHYHVEEALAQFLARMEEAYDPNPWEENRLPALRGRLRRSSFHCRLWRQQCHPHCLETC